MPIFICTRNFYLLQNNTKQKIFGFQGLYCQELIFGEWVNFKNSNVSMKVRMKR